MSKLVEENEKIAETVVPRFDQAAKIQFEGLSGYTINYEEESSKSYCTDDVYFTGDLPLDTDLVEDYLNALQGLSLTKETYPPGVIPEGIVLHFLQKSPFQDLQRRNHIPDALLNC